MLFGCLYNYNLRWNVADKELKTLHGLYCSVSKFVFVATVQKHASWNISDSGLCGNSLALNLNLTSKWALWNTKIYLIRKFHGVWAETKIKVILLR